MKKYMVKHYAVSVASYRPDEFIQEIYSKYLAPLASYISKPQNFFQIQTFYKNSANAELILTETMLLRDGELASREATMQTPLNQENANTRKQFPRVEFRRETPVVGNIERLLTANQFFPQLQYIRKGQVFTKRQCKFMIFREFWPAMPRVDDRIAYTGSQSPANAPMRYYGHQRFVEEVFGQFDKEIFGMIHSDFQCDPEIYILIEAEGYNDQENEVALLEMENVVGGIETEN